MGSNRNSNGARPRYLFSIIVNLACGIVSGLIVAVVGYYYVRDNLSQMISEGVNILDLDETGQELNGMIDQSREALTHLSTPTTRPSSGTVEKLRGQYKQLLSAVGSVTVTEYYTADELKSMVAGMTFDADIKDTLQAYNGKPKRVVQGVPQAHAVLIQMNETLEFLVRQLEQETHIDVSAATSAIRDIEKGAAATKAALESRQRTIQATLAKFGRR